MPAPAARFLLLSFLAWVAFPALAQNDEKNEQEKKDDGSFRIFTSARGNKTLRLKVLSRIDDDASHFSVTAAEWVPTDRQLADPLSRIPLGAAPAGSTSL